MWIRKFIEETASRFITPSTTRSKLPSNTQLICAPDEDTEEEYEERNGLLTRRKFFFMMPAAIIAAKYVVGIDPARGPWTGTIADAADFLAPGAIELERYRIELVRQVSKAFVLSPHMLLSRETLDNPKANWVELGEVKNAEIQTASFFRHKL